MSRRRAAILGFVVAVAAGMLAWSGALDPRPRFEATLPGASSYGALPVLLRDGTGLVVRLRAADPPAADVANAGSIENPAAESTTLLVDWLGGACDDRVDMALERRGSEYLLEMRTDTGFDLGCVALGVRRTVAIELSTDVDAAAVTLRWR